MTRAKRLIEVKKELRKVRKRMGKLKIFNETHCYTYNVDEYCFPKNVTEYTIITKQKVRYIINNLIDDFPDIDFKDIIYVSKIMGYLPSNTNNCWNTNIGFYNWRTAEGWKYLHHAEDRYKVVETIGDYED